MVFCNAEPCFLPIIVKTIDRTIETISIAVMPNHALAGRQIDIRGDKPASLGIVIAGLEIVEACLLVVDISPIAEGVQCAQCGCQGARAAKFLPPAVIGVFYHGVSAAVNELDTVLVTVARGSADGCRKMDKMGLILGALCRILYTNYFPM